MNKYVDCFKVFEAKYQTYSDYEKAGSKWATPDELKKTALTIATNLLPSSNNEVKSIEDQSHSQKGIKFEVLLKSGDKLHLYKTGRLRFGEKDWEIYLNKKKMRNRAHTRDELMKSFTTLDKYLYFMNGYDSTWIYADDGRAYKAGQSQADTLRKLYQKLTNADKKKAYNEFIKKFKGNINFDQFSGA